MPPVMMTAVMPSATMATNAKLRVTLKRFCGVAKVSVTQLSTTQAMTAATNTQKVWRDSSQVTRAVGLTIDGVVQRRGHLSGLLVVRVAPVMPFRSPP